MWTFPSWLAEVLIGLLPETSTSSLELLANLLRDAWICGCGDCGGVRFLGPFVPCSAQLRDQLVRVTCRRECMSRTR